MQLTNFASGSKGNSTLISLGGTHILIDCGISFRRLQQGLQTAGVGLESIDAVIITHLHSDHVAGLPVWCRRSNLRFLTPKPVLSRTARFAGAREDERRFSSLEAGGSTHVGSISIRAFPVSHDAPETVGLKLSADGESVACLTDLGVVTHELRSLLERQDAIFIEANHEPELVAASLYPEYVKQRILSSRGHLSNQQSLELLCSLKHPPRSVVFGHLSENNNSPLRIAARVAECRLEKRVQSVSVASQRETTIVSV